MTAEEMRRMLMDRARSEGRILAFEVSHAAGFDGTTRLDGVSISVHKGHGYALEGYEIKASRADLLRELNHPSKSQKVIDYLDAFWLVAAPGVCKPEELPAPWGLLVPRGQKLFAAKRAAPLEPKPMTRSFIVGFLLRLQRIGELPGYQADMDRARGEGFEDGYKRAEADARRGEGHSEALAAQVERLRDRITAFEEASGLAIDSYHGENLGAAMRIVLDVATRGRWDSVASCLGAAQDYAEKANKKIVAAAELLAGASHEAPALAPGPEGGTL